MNRVRALAAVTALLVALPAVVRAQAQGAVVTGKVTSEFGQPLEGANVFITELSLSVGTNAAGIFTINVPGARVAGQAAVLRVRSVGFAPQTRAIKITAGSQTLNFSLKTDVNRLEEIVVTGVTAGTEQRKLPFTVSRVDNSEMPVQSANPLTQLQGKVPGANIVSASGRPGSTPAVLLRGPKSINAQGRGQSPLYIVDGVELQGTLADVNPADIESVEIVKGAAASSLYGSRAGNGVIQITTKSGKGGGDGVHFNIRSEYGQGDIERQFPLAQRHFLMMDETHTRFCVTAGALCSQTVNFEDEALRVNRDGGDFSLPTVLFQQDGGIAQAPSKQVLRGVFQVEQFPVTYNPIGQMVTSGQHTNTTLDASGHFGGTTFFASASNYKDAGAIRFLDGYLRNSLRLNVDQNVGEKLTFGTRMYYARIRQDGANQEQGAGFFRLTRNPIGADLLRTDEFGRLFVRSNPLNQGSQNYNPAYDFAFSRQVNQSDRFIGSATTRYTPIDWLDFDANFSYDRAIGGQTFMEDKGFRTTAVASRSLGYIEQTPQSAQSYNTGVSATARQTLGDFSLRYTTRYQYEQQDSTYQNFFGSNLTVPGLSSATAATTGFGIRSTENSMRSIGMTAGVAADYKEKYIVDVLGRRDGSSLFGSDNRWANYGRASLAWRLSDEDWFKVRGISDLKLRSSIGTAGGRPSFAAQYETFTIGTGGTLTPNTLGNKNLRPETVLETEYGIDAQVLNRVGVNLTYAKSIAKDQILPVPAPASSGFSSQFKNAGTLENSTYELSLNVPLISKQSFTWSVRANYDRTRSMITKLDVPPFFEGTSYQATDKIFRFAEGERYAQFWGRKFITSCAELPSAFQSKCGAGQDFQSNSQGLIVWTGAGNTTGDGVKKNLWQAVLPAGASPFGVSTSWGMPMILRDSTGTGQVVSLGNALPDYRLSFSQTMTIRKLFIYAQMDGAFGQYVYNQGRHWSFGDFMDKEQDQSGESVESAKPLGYYWRATFPDNGAGVGGFYDFLGANNVTLEKSSYAKLREVNVSYNVGPVRGVGDWTVGVVGRNLHTFTKYTGFDPEVGTTNATSNYSGSAAIAAVDNYNFPNLRTFTFSIGSRF
jgi:TonB-linked SusC/RagA family outer membrane protein